ncbi:MAG: hypothetical protein AAF270_06865 [Pseudomonadota bacterium]
MPKQSMIFMSTTYLTTAIAGLMFWQAGWFLAALITLLLGVGIATAQPCIERSKLRLRGTPVLLMFAVMFVSASGMTFAIDSVASLFEPPADEKCVALSADDSKPLHALVLRHF